MVASAIAGQALADDEESLINPYTVDPSLYTNKQILIQNAKHIKERSKLRVELRDAEKTNRDLRAQVARLHREMQDLVDEYASDISDDVSPRKKIKLQLKRSKEENLTLQTAISGLNQRILIVEAEKDSLAAQLAHANAAASAHGSAAHASPHDSAHGSAALKVRRYNRVGLTFCI
ncbi:hypothetical protein BP00DRAFT_230036 [Aspergillus indologenus CBS 114.80]|uniref:Uncharacterized protein n=1 Tax=Aspergillus indologenus CBS 114.80 TaxID=1450541 RepID=A0A2V5HYM4_9EURO|nr:hypothetical protein BP00DRAFT_230036 [Aspergillus indologenus CBS 114.80]